jgi:hypothetical protein
LGEVVLVAARVADRAPVDDASVLQRNEPLREQVA